MQNILGLFAIICPILLQAVPVTANPDESDFGSGYDCNTEFISDKEVKTALLNKPRSSMSSHLQPTLYTGYLYTSKYNLLKLRILGHKRISEKAKLVHQYYYILYQAPENVISVFYSNEHSHELHCNRVFKIPHALTTVYSNTIPPSTRHIKDKASLSLFYNSVSGFLCGDKYINKMPVFNTHALVLEVIENGIENGAFSMYDGNIPEIQGPKYEWPLFDDSLADPTKQYPLFEKHYIITDQYWNFLRLVYKTKDKEHIICKEVPISIFQTPTLASTTTNNGNIQKGFLCDIFFDDEYLDINMQHAQDLYLNRYSGEAKRGARRSSYELKYPVLLGDTGLFIWPLRTDNTIFSSGGLTGYRLVLTRTFNIISVIMVRGNEIMQCKSHKINTERKREELNFKCSGQLYDKNIMSKIVERQRTSLTAQKYYPKHYNGPDFDVPGPYLVTLYSGLLNTNNIPHIVFTPDFFPVGLIQQVGNGFKKCERSNGKIPGGSSTGVIYETSRFLSHKNIRYYLLESETKRQKLS